MRGLSSSMWRCGRRAVGAGRLTGARSGVLAALAAATVVLSLSPAAGAAGRRDVPATAGHTITYDKYSLMIDGKRTFIWSGEFEYWRLPSPSLWLDILEKMKAEGYNAVTVYFNWAYHSPAPGVYDFSGVRNVNLLLDDAARVGCT